MRPRRPRIGKNGHLPAAVYHKGRQPA